MAIPDINRNVITQHVDSAYTAQITDDQIICDGTSAGFTVTLYQVSDGACHRLLVAVDPDDSSGNTITITDGTFSTTLSAAGAAVTLETQYDGSWMIAGEYPVTSTAAATSSATSAGLAASVAQSGIVSNSLIISQTGSTATSQNTSQSLLISQAGSNATSLATSNSLIISQTGSTATSQNSSQSLVISLVSSVANSG
jgi:hypothetical protein